LLCMIEGVDPCTTIPSLPLSCYSLHAKRDPKETTQAARAAFLNRFEREVDPDGSLPPAERARRAQADLRAHMTRLALASSRPRSRTT